MHRRFSTFIAAFSSAISAPACAAWSERPAAVIAYRDLDMRSPEQRQILISRIDRVAFELCRQEAETRRLGEHFNRFNPGWRVQPTRKSIKASLPENLGRNRDRNTPTTE